MEFTSQLKISVALPSTERDLVLLNRRADGPGPAVRDGKQKYSFPCRESNTGYSFRSQPI
jgi:hypothetical protein